MDSKHGDRTWIDVCNEVVMDPCNRDGEGCHIDEVLKKAKLIETHGFEYSLLRIILVEMPVALEARQAIFDFNNRLGNADPRYPKYDPNTIKWTCIGGNHLVLFLKMVRQRIPCDCFCSVPGPGDVMELSLEKLRSFDGDFANAVSSPVPTIPLLKRIRDATGDKMQVIMQGENQTVMAFTAEGHKQCLVRCAKLLHNKDFETDTIYIHKNTNNKHRKRDV